MSAATMEFRWLTRYIDFSPEAWSAYCKHVLDPDPPHPKQRVLQFRMMEGPRGEGWWGQWQDCPEEDHT